jgi:DNA glycosylase AlkZ-like
MAERFEAQLLAGEPATDPVSVVSRLLAVQGQDPRGARLAIRARSAGLTAADVDRALTQDRSLLITWLNRGTLHLVTSEDYWLLHPLTTPPLATSCARRLSQEGVPPGDAAKAVGVIEHALTADGPLTRRQLGERVAAAGVRTQGQAIVHVLFLASIRGLIVRGPMIGTEHGYALVRDWLGERPASLDRDLALAELARRYLAGHGPADDRDLAVWAGLPLRDARRGLSQIAAELADRDDGRASLASAVSPSFPPAGSPPPRLLGSYDPVLHGWASREPVTGSHSGIVTTNGLFRPFALVGGKAVALWSLSAGQVTLRPLEEIGAADRAALDDDAADVLRYLGLRPAGRQSPSM